MTQTESAATESPVGKWKPYLAYKDSGVEWLGKIPAYWEVKRLKHVAPSSTAKLTEKPDDLPYLGLENVESLTGHLLLDTPIENVESTVGLFNNGNVLFGKLRPYLAKVVYVDFSGVCTTELLVLQPNAVMNGKFLFYRLLSEDFIKLVNSLTYGTKMPRVSSEQIGNLPVSLPPLAEQHAIASFLDRETARINALIAKKERLIELLQEKRAALISHAVTKGLDSRVPMKDSGVEWLGEIPVHWKYLSVRNLIRDSQLSIQDGNHGELHPKAEDYVSEGIPFIMANNIRHGGIDLTNCKYISKETAESLRIGFAISGDVLLTHKGTLGETSIVPKMLNYPYIMLTPQVTFYRILKEALFNTFVYFYFQSKFFQKQMYLIASNQSTRDYVGLVAQKDLIIVLPPISEQKAIVTFLNSETVKIDALISRIRDGIEKLKEYSTALVSAAVTGKIDVRGEITSMDDIRH